MIYSSRSQWFDDTVNYVVNYTNGFNASLCSSVRHSNKPSS